MPFASYKKCVASFLLVFLTCLTSFGQGYHSRRFSYTGHDTKMVSALKMADSIYSLPLFWKKIREYPQQKIDTSTYTMKMLSDTLMAYSGPVAIIRRTYWPYPHATAMTNNQSITITPAGYHQKGRYFLAMTFMHEWAHVVDYTLHPCPKSLQFPHYDDQEPCLNKNTASYRVERVAAVILGKPDFALDCPK